MFEVPGIEVKLTEIGHFSVVRESLERIGFANKNTNTISPSCYLLHKQGRYYIIHFKNLLKMDGKKTDFTEEDARRQASIAKLLEKWKMVEIVDRAKVDAVNSCFVFVLPFEEKPDWRIVHKYTIGTHK